MDGGEGAVKRGGPRLASAVRHVRHVFVRDLVLEARIGVHDHELKRSQRVRFNVDLEVEDNAGHEDRLENVVCYYRVVEGIRALIGSGHIALAETLAERIAEQVLSDSRVHAARVRVEKLDIVPEAASVGVEIERRKGL
ncbi:MAG: dihydroneopterin aldolase [Rhodothalassiaceae bacterium]